MLWPLRWPFRIGCCAKLTKCSGQYAFYLVHWTSKHFFSQFCSFVILQLRYYCGCCGSDRLLAAGMSIAGEANVCFAYVISMPIRHNSFAHLIELKYLWISLDQCNCFILYFQQNPIAWLPSSMITIRFQWFLESDILFN